jgi:histidinol-phosphate aminotransferase
MNGWAAAGTSPRGEQLLTMPKTPDDIIRSEILALKGYNVPDSTGMVKLDAMENPYHLPAELTNAIAARVAGAELNRYPDSGSRVLKAQLREAMRIPADMDIVLGNGSDELIHLLALAVARPASVMLGLEPSFVMFRLIAVAAGLRYVSVPLTSDFNIDAAATLAAIKQHQPALIFIAYPNNPSGNLFDAETIARIIEAAPGIVVVDEAYHAFAGATFMPRLAEFPNLLVMRTLSKLGLAGLRLGLVAGRGAWLKHIDKVRLPYNVNVLTQVVASEVLRHTDVLDAQAAAIRAERARLTAELRHVPGVEAYASEANFILFRVANADQVFNGLKQHGVLIKNLNGTHPLLMDCLRVTVGTPDENAQFLAALKS